MSDSFPIERLIDEWQAGRPSDEGFRRIFERYYKPVCRFFERRGFSSEECQDLTQETFLRVFKGMGTFRREAPFEAWLYRIAANSYRKLLRSHSALKRAGSQVELDDESGAGREAPRTPGPLASVLAREQAERLRAAVAELPEQMRRVVTLRVYQDRSQREIAVLLRISVDTVKAHLHQARQRLKAALAEPAPAARRTS